MLVKQRVILISFSVFCGYQGLSVEARQHRECPKCHTVVEACCEGNNCFYFNPLTSSKSISMDHNTHQQYVPSLE